MDTVHRRFGREWWATYAPILAGVAMVAFLAVFFRFYFVPSDSMSPTIEPGSRVAALVVPYGLTHDYDRGDIVVFRQSGVPGVGGADVLVKRVVAVGGDTVSVSDGVLLVNGKASEWQGSTPTVGEFMSKVPLGQYFMMGDNRLFSIDSRSFGSVPAAWVLGRAVLVYMPRPHLL